MRFFFRSKRTLNAGHGGYPPCPFAIEPTAKLGRERRFARTRADARRDSGKASANVDVRWRPPETPLLKRYCKTKLGSA